MAGEKGTAAMEGMTFRRLATHLWAFRAFRASLAAACLFLATTGWAADIVKYYHLDAIGNVRVVTDVNGNVLERHDYLPFGEECTTGPCSNNPGAGAGQPRKFTGKERDPETGFDYLGARYYGSRIGRFTTADPAYTIADNLVDPQRWNRYAYARNNPLRYVDPDGKVVIEMPRATQQQNAAIRARAAEFLGAGPIGALADAALSTMFPVTPSEFAAGVEGSAFGMVAPLQVGPRILVNRLVGKAAEAKVADELIAEGKTIIGSQVCCRTPQGRRVVDHLSRDAAGEITAVEVKSGGATRNPAQRAKDADIAAGRGTFTGKNAPPDLQGQQRAVETIERKPNP